MKKAVFFSAMAVLAGAGAPAFAQEVSARVVSSTPVVQQVAVPQQNCAPQAVRQQGSGGGAVLGAIIGGVLGNGIGHGAGRALATGAGVFGGAMVGDRLENGQPAYAQNCMSQNVYENRTVGYNVVYEYGGRQYSTQMAYDPGPSIRLQGGAPVASNAPANGVVTAPPVANGDAYVQPLAQAPAPMYAAPAYAVSPAPVVYAAPYPVVYAPAYYRPYYYPPVSLSIGYVGGWGGHRHWR